MGTKIFKLILTTLAAWLIGVVTIGIKLLLSHSAAHFTLADVVGFGVLFVNASCMLMLFIYLPALFWLKRKQADRLWYPLSSGLLLNIPVFVLLGLLIGRNLLLSEALTFMLAFFLSGALFGCGFFWAHQMQPPGSLPAEVN